MQSKYNIDLTGKKFKHFTVIRQLDEWPEKKGYSSYQKWECACDCGMHFISNSYAIIREKTGCGINHDNNPVMIGLTFGKLTVKSHFEKQNSNRSRWWHCICSCGGSAVVRTTDLINGKILNCNRCSRVKYADRTIPAKKALYLHYKKDARKRNLTFELTTETFEEITSSACTYCGNVPIQLYKTNIEKKGRSAGIYRYNGVDRINNEIGYTRENCVPCCKFCNSAKHSMGLKEFIEWSYKLYDNLKKKSVYA